MLNRNKKYQKLIRFTEDFSAKNGTSPTVREIASHLKVSPSTAYRYVKKLEEDGVLSCGNGKKRSIGTVSGKVRAKAIPVPVYSELFSEDDTLFPKEKILFYLWLPSSRVRGDGFFATEASSDGFLPEGCLPGDFLIFKKTGRIKSGEVAIIDDGKVEKVVLAEFTADGFSVSVRNGEKEKRNELKIIGRLIAVQRLTI